MFVARYPSIVTVALFASLTAREADAQGQQLLGSWDCQTAEGTARLVFHSATQLSYNGEYTSYQVTGNVIRVTEEYGTVNYRYRLDGGALTVTQPSGSTFRCRRAESNTRTPAQGTGLESLLQGQICAYSSSPDGGLSTTRRLLFDGQGRFTYAELTEFDVPEAVGYGQGRGDPGSYRVMGSNRGDEVHLAFDGGTRVVVYVHHLYGGRIVELWHEGQVYGASLCPGQ